MRLAALLFLISTSAIADEFPDYDVQGDCNLYDGARVKIYCMRKEQEAHDQLKPVWASIPAEIRTTCDRSVSYLTLLNCIEDETEASGVDGIFKFNR